MAKPRDRWVPTLIIFDLDGTLLDAYPSIHRAYNEAMRQCGLPTVTLEALRPRVGFGVQKLLAPSVPSDRLAQVTEAFLHAYETHLFDGTHPYPGVIDTLHALKARQRRLAVASNKPKRFTAPLLDHLRLTSFFDSIVCGDELGALKPDPEVVQVILRRLAGRPEEALYVGDMVVDIETARRAGVRVAVVPTGSCTERELRQAEPDWVLPELRTLLELFA